MAPLRRAPNAIDDYNAYISSLWSSYYANLYPHQPTTTTQSKPTSTPPPPSPPIVNSPLGSRSTSVLSVKVSAVETSLQVTVNTDVSTTTSVAETPTSPGFPTSSAETAVSFMPDTLVPSPSPVPEPSTEPQSEVDAPIQTITANLNMSNSANLPTVLSIARTSKSGLFFTSISHSSVQPQSTIEAVPTKSKSATNALLIGLTVSAGVIFLLLGICLFMRARRKRSLSNRSSWRIPAPHHISQSMPPSYRTVSVAPPERIPDHDGSDGGSPAEETFLNTHFRLPHNHDAATNNDTSYMSAAGPETPLVSSASKAYNIMPAVKSNVQASSYQNPYVRTANANSDQLQPSHVGNKHLSTISSVTYASTAGSTMADHQWPDPPQGRLRPHMVIDNILRSSRTASTIPSILMPSIPPGPSQSQLPPPENNRSPSAAQTIDYFPNPYNGQLSPQSLVSEPRNHVVRPSMDVI